MIGFGDALGGSSFIWPRSLWRPQESGGLWIGWKIVYRPCCWGQRRTRRWTL